MTKKMKISFLFRNHWFIVIILLLIAKNTVCQQNGYRNKFDITFYFLDIEISDKNTNVKGSCSVGFNLLEKTDTIVLDMGSQLKVSMITIEGTQLDYKHSNDSLYIYHSFSTGQNSLIKIFYRGDAKHPVEDGAMFNSTGYSGKITYTLTEPFASKHWFPCKQDLHDKADSVFVYVTIPKGYKVGSNGLLKRIVDVDSDKVRYEWETRYPTAFYLISLAMANYRDYTIYAHIKGVDKPLPIINYIYNDDIYFNQNKKIIDTTADLIEAFSETFGVYPFINEKYGHCVVSEGGGMENQTMTTLGYFDFDLIAHELAHQWFGDEVTCSSWNDIWINEGFASYSEYIAHEKLHGIEKAKVWMEATHEYAMGLTDGSVYVSDSEVTSSKQIFDYRTTYKKGASIIHMIRYELNNDDLFFEILREFLSRYKYKSASAEDFKTVTEELSGRSFDNFFKEWYYGEGYPVLDISWSHQNDTLYIFNEQQGSAPEITNFFHINIQYVIEFPTGDTMITFSPEKPVDVIKIPFNKPVYNIIVDPNKYILGVFRTIQNIDSNKAEQKPLLIFPNPADTELTIFSRSIETLIGLTFYDIKGNKIKVFQNISTDRTKIPVGDLSDGVYIIQIQSAKFSSTMKFIKKHNG